MTWLALILLIVGDWGGHQHGAPVCYRPPGGGPLNPGCGWMQRGPDELVRVMAV